MNEAWIVYVWKEIPKHFHYKTMGARNRWMLDGAPAGTQSGTEKDPEEADVTFIFFDGDDQLGAFDPVEDGFVFVPVVGKTGLVIWYKYKYINEKPDPQISMSDEDGWPMPDESFVIPCPGIRPVPDLDRIWEYLGI